MMDLTQGKKSRGKRKRLNPIHFLLKRWKKDNWRLKKRFMLFGVYLEMEIGNRGRFHCLAFFGDFKATISDILFSICQFLFELREMLDCWKINCVTKSLSFSLKSFFVYSSFSRTVLLPVSPISPHVQCVLLLFLFYYCIIHIQFSPLCFCINYPELFQSHDTFLFCNFFSDNFGVNFKKCKC